MQYVNRKINFKLISNIFLYCYNFVLNKTDLSLRNRILHTICRKHSQLITSLSYWWIDVFKRPFLAACFETNHNLKVPVHFHWLVKNQYDHLMCRCLHLNRRIPSYVTFSSAEPIVSGSLWEKRCVRLSPVIISNVLHGNWILFKYIQPLFLYNSSDCFHNISSEVLFMEILECK